MVGGMRQYLKLGTVHFCVRILKIQIMVGYRWVGELREIGCSDFKRNNKYVHLKHVLDQVFLIDCL